MSAITRITASLVLLLAASASHAQSIAPAMRPLEALVKSSLLSFNEANVTGNYAVFHARLSKSFRQQFPPEKLKEVFRQFNEKPIDLDIVAAMPPIYDQEPTVDGDGKLTVKGFFATEPTRVNFEMDFVLAGDEWKLLRLNVVLASVP